MIVTIDGPAGAGKSTAAGRWRAGSASSSSTPGRCTAPSPWRRSRAGVALDDEAAPGGGCCRRLRLEMPPGGRVLLDGEDVSGADPHAGGVGRRRRSSRPARRSGRGWPQLQRQIAAGRDMVCEGRDQGTVVFPDAGCKFFLDRRPRGATAAAGARAGGERGRRSIWTRCAATRPSATQRDAGRELAPLRPADDAVVLDSTALTLEQVVERMEQEVRGVRHGRWDQC